MKKNQITLLIIFVLVVGIGIGAVLLLQSNSGDADSSNDPKSNVTKQEENGFEIASIPSNLHPYGLYSSDDFTTEEGEFLINHHFQRLDGEREVFLQSTYPSYVPGIMRTDQFLYANEGDGLLEIKLWDITQGLSQHVHTIAQEGYNFYLNSLQLSPDGKSAYIVVNYWDEDYNSRWNDSDFSLGDINTATDLYILNVESGGGELLYSQETNLETFSILDATDKYLILEMYATEADWQELGIYHLKSNQLEIYENNRTGGFFTQLSFDRKYLLYSTGLLSKAGDYDLSTLRLIDMETLDEQPLSFLEDYTAGNQFDSKGNIDSWVGYWATQWDTDNSKFYTIRQSGNYDSEMNYDLLEVDLENQAVKTIMSLTENSALLGASDGSYYIQEPGENETEKLVKYPGGEVVATYEQFISPELVWIENASNASSISLARFTSAEYKYSFEYPSDWWHNSVPEENLENAPGSVAQTLSLEIFGMGNEEDYKGPYSEDNMMFSMGITVYAPREGYTIADVKQGLGLNGSGLTSKTAGQDYDALLKVTDDSNHEIAAARMYLESYYIQGGEHYYEIYFAALNEDNLEENRTTIQSILDSFSISDVGLEDFKNGYSAIVPNDWNMEYSYTDAINTVKYGSPAQIFTLTPEGFEDAFGGPAITIQTFTIDKDLSAEEVANLIHDWSIADKIEQGTDECYFASSLSYDLEVPYYAFRSDNSDTTKCTPEATEVSVGETVVIKEVGEQSAMVATYSSTPEGFDSFTGVFTNFLSSLEYSPL